MEDNERMSDAMRVASSRRDSSARSLMMSAVDDAERLGFRVDFVSRPCCRYAGSHLDIIEQTIHILTEQTDASGEWRNRSDSSIAISLAHEVGHALDPPTASDQALTDPVAIHARRLAREATAWSYVERRVALLGLPDSFSQEMFAQRECARIAYEEHWRRTSL